MHKTLLKRDGVGHQNKHCRSLLRGYRLHMNRLVKDNGHSAPFSVGIIMHTTDNHFVHFQKKIKDFIINEVVFCLFYFNE